MTQIALTVFFEDPFWVGVFERQIEDELTAARVVFGAEPSDMQVFIFIMQNYNELRFSPPVPQTMRKKAAQNPKRMQRKAARESKNTGVGTKAQQALQAMHEAGKQTHDKIGKRLRTERAEQQFALKQAKKKEKHRGH